MLSAHPLTSATAAVPAARVWGLTIAGSECDGLCYGSEWLVALWQGLDLCAQAEQRRAPLLLTRGAGSADGIIPALTVLRVDFYQGNDDHCFATNTPIVRKLSAAPYAALTARLAVLRIKGNRHDDAADLNAGTIGRLHHLRELSLPSAALSSLQGLQGLAAPLKKVDFSYCLRLDTLAGLEGHPQLEAVDVSHAPITSLRPLQACRALTSLDVSWCGRIDSLEGLEGGFEHLQSFACRSLGLTTLRPMVERCPALRRVVVSFCSSLTRLEGLEACPLLEELEARYTPIQSLLPLRSCSALRRVDVSNCSGLTSLEGLGGGEGGHAHLEEINAANTAIRSLPSLQSCVALRQLALQSCPKLASLAGCEGMPSLAVLMVGGSAITSLLPLQGCQSLQKLNVVSCAQLASLEGIGGVPGRHCRLEEVNAAGTAVSNESVEGALRECAALKKLVIRGCRQINRQVVLPGIEIVH